MPQGSPGQCEGSGSETVAISKRATVCWWLSVSQYVRRSDARDVVQIDQSSEPPVRKTQQRQPCVCRSRPFERTSWNRLARDGVLITDIVRRRDRRKTPMLVLEALRSWRYAKAQPTAAVRR